MLSEVFSKNFNSDLPPLSESDCQQFTVDPSSPTPESILCTQQFVSNLLNGLDTSKASGPDGISGYMLKGTAQSIASSLTMLFNMSIRSGRVPKMWKVSSVVPIPKTATSTDNPSNYRRISLLPVVSKLLEKHIYSIVFEHLAERKLLSVDQWGFCPGKYTVTALTSTFHNVFQLLEAGFDVSLDFFDLCKAFDSIPHLPLLQKQKDTDLNQHILQWISSYLCNNTL